MANPSYGRAFVPRPRPLEHGAPPTNPPGLYPAPRPNGRPDARPDQRYGIVEPSRRRDRLPERPGPARRVRHRHDDRRPIHWLLVIPVGMPLLVPLYNRVDPKLAGIPFFYWYQMATALVAVVVMTFLYLVTKDRGPR
jgi:Protein of unknown function (DUF3311)